MLIARALLLDIEFLVADEIISMLDASTRIDVLNLLGDLKSARPRRSSSSRTTSRWATTSATGRSSCAGAPWSERGATTKVFGNPHHPYTQMLLASVPQLHTKWGEVERQLGAPAPASSTNGSLAGVDEPQELDPGPLVQVEDDHFVARANGVEDAGR